LRAKVVNFDDLRRKCLCLYMIGENDGTLQETDSPGIAR